MTDDESAFLCQLIKEKSPRKILEVGVAAGGTSAIILNCLTELRLEAELFSVDISKEYYRDKTRKTGYLVETSGVSNADRQKLFIGYLSDYIEKIGEIDFCIIDTMHCTPGEVLDFLIVFPYLTSDAVVVLHDTGLHYRSMPDAYATQLLLDCIVADKITYASTKNQKIFPNIGAFRINEDTEKYIDNVFEALNITWNYMPEEEQKESYLKFLLKHYSEKQVGMVEAAFDFNYDLQKRKNVNRWNAIFELLEFNKMLYGKKVWLYGAGEVGGKVRKLIEAQAIDFQGFIVSENQKKATSDIHYLRDVEMDDDSIIIVTVGILLKDEILKVLANSGKKNYMMIPENAYNYIRTELS